MSKLTLDEENKYIVLLAENIQERSLELRKQYFSSLSFPQLTIRAEKAYLDFKVSSNSLRDEIVRGVPESRRKALIDKVVGKFLFFARTAEEARYFSDDDDAGSLGRLDSFGLEKINSLL